MLLDEEVKRNVHTDTLYSKLSKVSHLLKSLSNTLLTWSLMILYNSYYYSRLTYGIHLWAPNFYEKYLAKIKGLHS